MMEDGSDVHLSNDLVIDAGIVTRSLLGGASGRQAP
jgi:hypothetical protein